MSKLSIAEMYRRAEDRIAYLEQIYGEQKTELEAAREREKALRRRVEDVRLQMHGPLREKLWEALAKLDAGEEG